MDSRKDSEINTGLSVKLRFCGGLEVLWDSVIMLIEYNRRLNCVLNLYTVRVVFSGITLQQFEAKTAQPCSYVPTIHGIMHGLMIDLRTLARHRGGYSLDNELRT